jgi:hypothetical protein
VGASNLLLVHQWDWCGRKFMIRDWCYHRREWFGWRAIEATRRCLSWRRRFRGERNPICRRAQGNI